MGFRLFSPSHSIASTNQESRGGEMVVVVVMVGRQWSGAAALSAAGMRRLAGGVARPKTEEREPSIEWEMKKDLQAAEEANDDGGGDGAAPTD